MIAFTIYKTAIHHGYEHITEATFNATTLFPVLLAACGLIGCLIGLGYAAIKKMGDNPSRELDLSSWISAGITIVLGGIASYIMFGSIALYDEFVIGWASPWVSAILGIASGVAIGKITEYYTSTDYSPTKKLADMATEGSAFVITKGDAIGSRSCLLPIIYQKYLTNLLFCGII
jgi:K(+)-stimulated pyrophosphate-energized sodium pump